jgi:phenylpyruvate tautomerase PptA (4-oxalocrotonate tautomerase family)
MPASLIEIRRTCTSEEESALMNSVHDALVEAFRIPDKDRNIRLVVHEPNRFQCSPLLDQPHLRTIVTIDCLAGRSIEAKRHLYTEIVNRLAELGIPRDHVSVILHEVEQQNWALGGLPASEIDLGFTVEI